MEWWKLWVPFGATILGIIANVWINITQNKKQQAFQKEMTKTQIDANLKAKARIEWISQVRELVSTYISELSKLELILEKMIKSAALMNASDLGLNPPNNPSDLSIFFDENVVLIKQSRISINEYSEKVLLYFSEKEEHQEIEDAVTMIPKSLGNFETLVDNNLPVQTKINILLVTQNDLKSNIAEIRSIFRKYLKIEWDKAKEGK